MKVEVNTIFNPATGRILWQVETDQGGHARGSELMATLEDSAIPHSHIGSIFTNVRREFIGLEGCYTIKIEQEVES
ncbi:hypothetical protein [Marinoscillum furvescens]|uniref:Uncharacterized protein n=1 Tax=Marinoscillum furvescens DSM 4134 TaxID=1122208 RepID=A0A3D9L516_MARFU|nr:hypothetical protein [Marinoscillum furvescens]REE01082.1 hypothetical protein C7460_104102 [Marinoscillum furvescens DSM 4134]